MVVILPRPSSKRTLDGPNLLFCLRSEIHARTTSTNVIPFLPLIFPHTWLRTQRTECNTYSERPDYVNDIDLKLPLFDAKFIHSSLNGDTAMNEELRPAKFESALPISPSVFGAALVAAHEAGVPLQTWLDEKIAKAIAESTAVDDARSLAKMAPWSFAAAELFVQVANNAPESLQGRWATLFDRVSVDQSLWNFPQLTLEEVEHDSEADAPYLSFTKLKKVWPQLCASIFCL